jgi:uncharacterized protein YndB with AHSA1/START domain
MPDLPLIEWRVHLNTSPDKAYEPWATDAGRELFWAERSEATPDGFRLSFIGGETFNVQLLEAAPPRRFAFSYFGGSRVAVEFEADASGGCDVHLTEEHVPEAEHLENYAGWVSVLLGLKAAVDFGVDLRGHDSARSWAQRFVDN